MINNNQDIMTLAFAELKTLIFPFIHNKYSAPEDNLMYAESMAKVCPNIVTSGVYVFFSLVPEPGNSLVAPITITEELADAWGVTTIELCEAAFQNLDNLPLRIERVENQKFFSMDTSSDVFPNFECSRFLSKKSLEKMKKVVGGDFYIFPVSVWKTYLMREDDVEGMDPSTMVTIMLAKGGMPEDVLLRHGYIYKKEKLNIVELTASKNHPGKVYQFPTH